MGTKMLIDASQPEETRVVVARGNRLEEFDFESASKTPLKGNIYLAKVTRVEPSLQAAFVEYGGNRHGFLAFAEIHPDYYQIPIADRLALLKEQEEDDAQFNAEEDDDDDVPNSSHHGESEAKSADHDHDDDHHDDKPSDEAHAAMPLEADELPSLASVSESSDEDASEPVPTPEVGELVSIESHADDHKIESVGAEDALEEVPQRRQQRRPRRRVYKIQEVIKRRQILLV
jgi:ribonuclease E